MKKKRRSLSSRLPHGGLCSLRSSFFPSSCGCAPCRRQVRESAHHCSHAAEDSFLRQEESRCFPASRSRRCCRAWLRCRRRPSSVVTHSIKPSAASASPACSSQVFVPHGEGANATRRCTPPLILLSLGLPLRRRGSSRLLLVLVVVVRRLLLLLLLLIPLRRCDHGVRRDLQGHNRQACSERQRMPQCEEEQVAGISYDGRTGCSSSSPPVASAGELFCFMLTLTAPCLSGAGPGPARHRAECARRFQRTATPRWTMRLRDMGAKSESRYEGPAPTRAVLIRVAVDPGFLLASACRGLRAVGLVFQLRAEDCSRDPQHRSAGRTGVSARPLAPAAWPRASNSSRGAGPAASQERASPCAPR